MNIAPNVRVHAKRLLLLSPAGLGMMAAACGFGGSSSNRFGGSWYVVSPAGAQVGG